jgi:NAD(P)-dependent dehydrogenase (short-subunit alcohol dehydrogenase family)
MPTMDLGLKGRRALVTGSTAGIGEAIAKLLAAEGVAVAVNGRSERRGPAVVEAIRAAGGEAVLALGDVASDAGADRACQAAIDGLGGVDILISNAAGRAGSSISRLFDIPPTDWLSTYDKNVGAAVRMLQRLTPAMAERGWGRVIHIGSAVGAQPSGEVPDYAAAKTALIGFTLTASRSLAGTGVTVNIVSPGTIYTRSVAAWFKEIGAREGWGDDEAKSEVWVLNHMHKQDVRRIGRVGDIAAGVAYLASPLADYVTGINLKIDGGSGRAIY